MTAEQVYEAQQEDILNIAADIDRPSDRIRYAFVQGYEAGRAELAAENAKLRVRIQTWEEFDFERDNPARLVEHVLALMIERDRMQRRAEVAEAVIAATNATGAEGDERED